MESGGITVTEFFDDLKPTTYGRHRQYTEREKEIIVYAYENGYILTDVAEKLKTTTVTMRAFYRAYKRANDGR